MASRKPYLRPEHVGDGETNAVVEWMGYLSDTFGTGGALYALSYYERLGWVSAEARDVLTSHLRGLSTAELHNKKYDEPGTLDGPLAVFSGTAFGVHAKSMVYVARIAEDDLDEQVLMSQMAENRTDEERPVVE
jgi:archaellum component FlaD/FlaE